MIEENTNETYYVTNSEKLQSQLANLKDKINCVINFHHSKSHHQQPRISNFELAIREETIEQTPLPIKQISLQNISKNHFRAIWRENPQNQFLLYDVQCRSLVYMMYTSNKIWNNSKIMAHSRCYQLYKGRETIKLQRIRRE